MAMYDDYKEDTIEPVLHKNKIIAFLVNDKLIPFDDLRLAITSSDLSDEHKKAMRLLLQQIESGSMTTYPNDSPYAQR